MGVGSQILSENATKIIHPEHLRVIFEGDHSKTCLISEKLIPQEFFCIIGGRRDHRLFHVELRDMFVTLEKTILTELFCVIDHAKLWTLNALGTFSKRVPNLPGANPLVAERASWRSSQSCVTGGQQPIGTPYRFLCHFLCTPGNPCATPIVTRWEGSFSYHCNQGVSTRGVRQSPFSYNEYGMSQKSRELTEAPMLQELD